MHITTAMDTMRVIEIPKSMLIAAPPPRFDPSAIEYNSKRIWWIKGRIVPFFRASPTFAPDLFLGMD